MGQQNMILIPVGLTALTALARLSSKSKVQTSPLVKEGITK
jgi:hypothetical protein